jgi:hypothetical protein
VGLKSARAAAGKANDLAEARWQIAELQRLAGRQQLELDFFKKALRLFEPSTPDAQAPDANASSPSSKR